MKIGVMTTALNEERFIVSHAIFNEEEEICATVHYVDEGIDTGDIIYEKLLPIKKTDTARTLYTRCTNISLKLFEKVLKQIIKGNILPRGAGGKVRSRKQIIAIAMSKARGKKK